MLGKSEWACSSCESEQIGNSPEALEGVAPTFGAQVPHVTVILVIMITWHECLSDRFALQ